MIKNPVNENYCGTTLGIKNLIPLKNSDNLVGVSLLGYQAIVSKDVKIGDIGILFPAETQLSEEYCYENNLYSRSELNKDKDAKGYLGNNRRVRAIKLRGNISDCLFMPVSSLSYTGDLSELTKKVGVSFDELNGIKICNKYEIPQVTNWRRQSKTFRKEIITFPKHFDSVNIFKILEKLDPENYIIITQKLHGTSIRVGFVPVERKLKWYEKILKKLKIKIKNKEFEYMYGSRKVTKNSQSNNNFYEEDIWTRKGREISSLIPKNYILYGEIIGWANTNSPIQKNYMYDLIQGKSEIYIYRISVINEDGIVSDLSWDLLMEFCIQVGLKHVPMLYYGKLKDIDITNEFLNKKFYPNFKNAVPLSNESPCDEGVCIRIDKLVPEIYKAKSSVFREHETKLLDENIIGLE